MKQIEASELILNSDGSVYHLHLLPEHIADTIFLVGDQDRVKEFSKHFEKIEVKIQNREFITHTGYFNNKRLSIISTGIGTDNIDIVVNELDALVNIDLKNRVVKETFESLNLVRIGTSGALQFDIPIDQPLASATACGFDGLLNFYQGRSSVSENEIEAEFCKHLQWNNLHTKPYFVSAAPELMEKIAFDMESGITISAPGFYGPQGRVLRLPIVDPDINDKISSFRFQDRRITNYEMECSAIYGLSKLLGHKALTICNIVANRKAGKFSENYKASMETLIQTVLERISK